MGRETLPAPEVIAEGAVEAPRDVVEQRSIAQWSELLRLVDVIANFFVAGGHLLLAFQLLRRA